MLEPISVSSGLILAENSISSELEKGSLGGRSARRALLAPFRASVLKNTDQILALAIGLRNLQRRLNDLYHAGYVERPPSKSFLLSLHIYGL